MKNEAIEERQMKLPLEELVKTNISTVVARKAELQEARDAFNSMLEENEEYKRASQLVKDAQQSKKSAKEKLLKRPEVIEAEQKVKDFAFDLKEVQQTLNELALQYANETGNSEVVDNIGTKHEIKISASVKI